MENLQKKKVEKKKFDKNKIFLPVNFIFRRDTQFKNFKIWSKSTKILRDDQNHFIIIIIIVVHNNILLSKVPTITKMLNFTK